MRKYIDQEELIKTVCKEYQGCMNTFFAKPNDFVTMIEDAPTVEIVHCKDCKHRNTDECAMWLECSQCGGQWSWCNDNDFCSYGERKE